MRKSKNWSEFAGRTLHLLIGGMLLLAGAAKLLGLFPAEPLEKLGLGGQIRLLGAGELVTAVLLLIPRTASLGTLLASAFWGGTICIHMAHGESYLFQAVTFILSWAGAYLRNPATLGSFSGAPSMTREVAAESEPAVP